jgi:hypothetical protein
LFTFDKKKKQVVQSVHKKRKTITNQSIMKTIETTIFYVGRMVPMATATSIAATVQASESQVLKMTIEIESHKAEIAQLKNQVCSATKQPSMT